jgi:hypothetical protein
MPWIDSLDYLNLNSLRRYPLREGTSVKSLDGLFELPDTFIVEFSLAASNDVSKRYYISKFFNKIFSVTIEISEIPQTAEESIRVVGSFDIDLNNHKVNDTYYLIALNDYVGARGRLTVGNVDDLRTQPAGNFSFTSEATEFEPKTIVPGLAGVTRIKYVDSEANTRSLTGDVVMQARNNMRFQYEVEENRVVMDVGDNLGLNKNCDVINCVRRINGVGPADDGNLSLVGVDCLNISSTAPYTLELKDSCCTPCSGCEDLSELTTRLTSLENKFIELKSFYTTINGQLTNYLTTVNSNCECP